MINGFYDQKLISNFSIHFVMHCNQSKSRRIFFYFISIFLPFTIFISCENDIQTINLITSNQQKRPIESGKNVEIIYSDSAKLKMKMKSPLVDRYVGANPYLEMPKGVKLEFYQNDPKIMSSKLTANYAIRYEAKKKMEAKGNVVVINEKNETLNTEHLVWDEAKHTIYTDEFVKIQTANEVIYGDGLESNESFTKYKITNIKGTIQLKENQ